MEENEIVDFVLLIKRVYCNLDSQVDCCYGGVRRGGGGGIEGFTPQTYT